MLSRLVFSKNNLFFAFLIFGYLFGVIFYDFIGFDYVDELMALFLVVFTGMVVMERKKWKELIPIGIVAGIFIFYLIFISYQIQYSHCNLHGFLNTTKAFSGILLYLSNSSSTNCIPETLLIHSMHSNSGRTFHLRNH